MALSSLTCPPPIRRTNRATPADYEVLDAAIELHGEGRYAESLARTFEHLFPDLDVPDLSAHAFSFGQGSSRVSVEVSDGSLHVRVPLVRLRPESLTTAALRFVLSRISATGQLYQPCLRGDELYLEFSERLTRLHPHKVREVLRQMPIDADANDDWMVAEFKCEPLAREAIEPLSAEELMRAEAIWRTHWDEVDELVKESQRKRSMFFLNEVTAYAIYHVRHALPLTGYWWSKISAAADTFNDNNNDPNVREAALAKCSKEMKAVTAELLADSLGHARYAIPPHSEGTARILASNLGDGEYLHTVVRLFNGGRYMDAAVALIGSYNYLLARFSWSDDVERMLLEGLALATGKPWREATGLLLEHAALLIAATDADDDDDDDAENEDEDEDDEGEEQQ